MDAEVGEGTAQAPASAQEPEAEAGVGRLQVVEEVVVEALVAQVTGVGSDIEYPR